MSQTRSADYPNPRGHEADGPTPKLAPTEASQGVTGHNARVVLVVGTIGAIVAVAIAYFGFFAA